jgi:hypothetical protein
MSDNKLLFCVVAAMGLFAAGWWYGWFGPVTKMFMGIKSNVVARP